MEKITLSRTEETQYMRSIVLNTAFVVVIWVIGYFYILSWYSEILANIDSSNAEIARVRSLETEGVSPAAYKKMVATYGSKESADELDANSVNLKMVLKKPDDFSGNYISWVSNELISSSASKYDEANEANQAILWSILPTWSDNISTDKSSVFDKNRITLSNFVRYIEDTLLKRFALDSFSPIGIGDIAFENAKGSSSIGSFVLNLDFDGRNDKILEFITSLQKSGQISVVNGRLVGNQVGVSSSDPTLSTLGNFLVTIDALRLKNSPMTLDGKNSGSIALRFYVRGRTYASFLEMRSMMASSMKDFEAKLTAQSNRCRTTQEDICQNDTANEAFSNIRSIAKDFAKIQTSMQDLQKRSNATDFSKDTAPLLGFYTSFRALEKSFNHSMDTINSLSDTKQK